MPKEITQQQQQQQRAKTKTKSFNKNKLKRHSLIVRQGVKCVECKKRAKLLAGLACWPGRMLAWANVACAQRDFKKLKHTFEGSNLRVFRCAYFASIVSPATPSWAYNNLCFSFSFFSYAFGLGVGSKKNYNNTRAGIKRRPDQQQQQQHKIEIFASICQSLLDSWLCVPTAICGQLFGCTALLCHCSGMLCCFLPRL